MENVLIADEKYNGKYVVIKGLSDPVVISSDIDPKVAYDAAMKKGFKDFLLLFVPEKALIHIYRISL